MELTSLNGLCILCTFLQKEAVQVHVELGSKQSLAIHFGTFHLADEAFDEPVIELRKELKNREIPLEDFWALKHGETKKIINPLRTMSVS